MAKEPGGERPHFEGLETEFERFLRHYERRERARALQHGIDVAQRQQAAKQKAQKRSDMYTRLEEWDDSESDELFYVDRPEWRTMRARQLAAEQSADIMSGVRERADMCTGLQTWNDDDSDELFYVDRPRWRTVRARYLAAEQAADAANAAWDEEGR
ncbi:hypothetical protein K438DRAFT_1763148 [Mycena galopus ATCC 62051]|nr:hypothetical protein K438DRAFT_1763148 [Mycena galopus ATCC 62051]